jgi:hypothetical protein
MANGLAAADELDTDEELIISLSSPPVANAAVRGSRM